MRRIFFNFVLIKKSFSFLLGRTALHWAATVNNCEVICALLVNGANKDMQDQRDMTPLFLAAREGCRDAVKILLNAGADRDIPDDKGRLPREIAQERCHHDLVDYISQFVPSTASQSDLLFGIPVASATMRQQATNSRKPRPKRRSKSGSAESTPRDKKDLQPEIVNVPTIKIKKTKADDFLSTSRSGAVDLASIGSLSPVGSFDLPPSYESACGVNIQPSSADIMQDQLNFDSKFFGNDFLSCPSHLVGTDLASMQCSARASGRSVPSGSVQSPDVSSPYSGSGSSPLSCGSNGMNGASSSTDGYFGYTMSQQQALAGRYMPGQQSDMAALFNSRQGNGYMQPSLTVNDTSQTLLAGHQTIGDMNDWMVQQQQQQQQQPMFHQQIMTTPDLTACYGSNYNTTNIMNNSQMSNMQQQQQLLQQQLLQPQVNYFL